jgi:hypothetical protein
VCFNVPVPSRPPVSFDPGLGAPGPATITFNPYYVYNGGGNGTVTAWVNGGNGAFSSAHGMPLFQYFDQSVNLVTQTTATSVAADGSHASSPVPDLSSVGPGVYAGWASNANASGGYTLLGAGSMQVASGVNPNPSPCSSSVSQSSSPNTIPDNRLPPHAEV